MNRLSIRWLLLGVAAISLLVPVALILSLRTFDAVLVRQTERELNAQGAVIAAVYQEAWTNQVGKPMGNPRDRWHATNTYTPLVSRVANLDHFAPPVPDPLPTGKLSQPQLAVGQRLSAALRSAQVFNLSGVRVLDERGCALASSRRQIGNCYQQLPEVKHALSGKPRSVIRERISDEPAPPLTSFRRRGDVRVFVALPVWNENEVIGAVLLSRTAESGLEWLFKRRRGIFYAGLFMLALTTAVSVGFSFSITRPLSRMVRILRNGSSPEGDRLSSISAPKEIHALGVALDDRTEQLEEKSRYIAEFAAQVSHELKTPLTSIRGAVELLQDAQNMSEEQRQKFLGNIDAATERTARLVTRLLYLARLESPQDESEADDPIVVEKFLQSLAQRYPEHVEFEINAPANLELSERDLEAVLGNLIDNALRYRTSEPVRVFIQETEGRLHLSVTDDGPGISKENQARLFQRFFTTERDKGGTGLGLSIVQATAQKRGGRATVTSSKQGTRVDVWL